MDGSDRDRAELEPCSEEPRNYYLPVSNPQGRSSEAKVGMEF
jgi:hypothetical protein